MTLSETSRQFVELTRRKRDLERRLADLRQELEPVRQELLDQMAEAGLQNLTLDDGAQVYLHRRRWAKVRDGDYERAVQALRNAGLSHMVRPLSQSVSAFFRDLEDPAEAGPEMLEAFEVVEDVDVRVRL